MTDAVELIQVDFDNSENHDAITKKSLGCFIAGDGLSESGKLSKWMREHLPPVKMYTGWDGSVYPQFVIKRIRVY